jgi:NAD(P)-dependent dehydrogenase (short-subunit alcohol dehydrogenase family)
VSDFFSGKVAIVTGGASGIGRAVAEALARRSAQVVVADLNADGAADVARQLCSLGGGTSGGGGTATATSHRVDVTNADEVESLVTKVAADHGRVDLMFNNAGIAIVGEAAEFSINDWDRLVDVNIRGVIYGTHAAYRRMIEQGHGHIINTASIAGLVPAPTFTAYAATKHAVVGLSTSLRVEAERRGVHVSVICPGVIDTPMVDNAERIGFARKIGREDLGFKPYNVARCADDILAGVERNDPIIVVTPMAKTLYALSRYAPSFGRWVAKSGYNRARKA